MTDTTGLILVLPATNDVERDAVAHAWESTGGDVARLDRFWEPPALDPTAVRIYGPTTFALVLQEIWPITLVSPPDDLILRVPPRLLSRRIELVSLGEARLGPFPRFVKPLVSKVFRATVFDAAQALRIETAGLPDATPVLRSPPVAFTAEVRVFAHQRQRLSWAAYEGAVVDAGALISFVDDALGVIDWNGPMVVDFGYLTDAGWAVVEINEAWGAGLNGCDATAVLPAISAATTSSGGAPPH